MRKNVRMTFIKGKNTRGYMGHWCMAYYVDNVIDIDTGEVICDEYIFKNSTVFKGKGLKMGDIVEMSINVEKDDKGKVKLSYYSNIKKVENDE